MCSRLILIYVVLIKVVHYCIKIFVRLVGPKFDIHRYGFVNPEVLQLAWPSARACGPVGWGTSKLKKWYLWMPNFFSNQLFIDSYAIMKWYYQYNFVLFQSWTNLQVHLNQKMDYGWQPLCFFCGLTFEGWKSTDILSSLDFSNLNMACTFCFLWKTRLVRQRSTGEVFTKISVFLISLFIY